ncbi:hypothetical protein Cri9333_0709 [Crinalium epipsammum PCC 9333]|uniref:Uncharacterized protein n=1 Tax=Crinalium epipsammum PCC 9333 TaxID=1173022 RepID=K9VUM2_9CYAN|nr:hypothetical protein [Crinalium epipsammum]AFZ11641.1 hypothetical protein Cri9333_0709 [Crinalium epipsammum PCC 9333]
MSINKQELIRRVSQRVSKETGAVEEIVDATACKNLRISDALMLKSV